jgi:hypothetical protein
MGEAIYVRVGEDGDGDGNVLKRKLTGMVSCCRILAAVLCLVATKNEGTLMCD